MLYPIFIHMREANEAIGFEFPDFPGCFSAADEWSEVTRMAQEAVECHFMGDEIELPKPSDPLELQGRPEYADGLWMMVDIDLSKLDPTPMRVNISLPNYLLVKIDEYTAQHRETRSGFLARAALSAMAN